MYTPYTLAVELPFLDHPLLLDYHCYEALYASSQPQHGSVLTNRHYQLPLRGSKDLLAN